MIVFILFLVSKQLEKKSLDGTGERNKWDLGPMMPNFLRLHRKMIKGAPDHHMFSSIEYWIDNNGKQEKVDQETFLFYFDELIESF